MYTQLKKQSAAFIQGFHSLIDKQWIASFSPNELQRLISGDHVDLDVDELRYVLNSTTTEFEINLDYLQSLESTLATMVATMIGTKLLCGFGTSLRMISKKKKELLFLRCVIRRLTN